MSISIPPCFEIPEIRARIFKIHEGNYTTLHALALTCRTFTDSALDILWRNQSNLVYLFRAMSQKGDLWTAPKNRNRLKHMQLLRDIEEKDIERFFYYSRRVRTLRLEKMANMDLPCHILSALIAAKPSQSLLPHLSQLLLPIDWGINESVRYLPSLLSSTLTNLELHIHGHPNNSRSAVAPQSFQFLLTEVTRIASNLRSFTAVFMSVANYNYSSIFERFVETLPDLVKLSCGGLRLTPALLERLSSNRALLALNQVCFDGLQVDPNWASRFGSAGFAFLKELQLLSTPLDHLRPCLEALDSPLEILHLTIADEAADITLGGLESLCSAIAKFNRLRTLVIENDLTKLFSLPPIPSVPIFSQLFCLRGLKTALINLPCVEELEPATMSLMPTMWPSIAMLSVALASPTGGASPKITLEELAAMSCKCAQLEALTISADLRPFRMPHPLSIANENVEHVAFIDSVLSSENIPSIIRCLCIMFPSANTIEGAGRPVDDWEDFRSLAEDFFQPVLGPEWFE